MKALTLWQPWATLIMDGIKTRETRTWPPPSVLVGDRLAIHAGRRMAEQWMIGEDVEREMSARHGQQWKTSVERGMLLGSVMLKSVHRVQLSNCSTARRVMYESEDGKIYPIDSYGDYSVGMWIWEISDPQPIEPRRINGQSWLWDVTI